MFERFHRSDKERAVADGQNNMFRDTAELFIHLIDIGFHTFIKEGIHHVVGVVDALFTHSCAANIGTVVARPGNNMHFGAVRLNHGDLLGARSFRNIDFALNACPGAVCCYGVAGIAARVLHTRLHPDRLHMCNQRSRSAILKGERRHGVVDLDVETRFEFHQGRHAFTQ